MTCWSTIESKAICESGFLPPVQFRNLFGWISPIFKVLTDAECTDHLFHFRHEFLHGLIVQMVIMVVRYHQIIYLRHVCRLEYISSFEGFASKTEWCGIVEYRVHKDTFAAQLK